MNLLRQSTPVTPVSKSSVLVNLIQAFCAVVLGNVVYFFLAPSLPLPRHRPFQMDVGLIVDFWFCLVAYGLIRTARRWKIRWSPIFSHRDSLITFGTCVTGIAPIRYPLTYE
jgi:hypothetical protein